MVGKESLTAGVIAAAPGWDGILCMAGTCSRRAEISAGEVVSFRSFVTGALFDLLSGRPAPRHEKDGGWNKAARDAALANWFAHPEALTARLFALRAEGLLAGLSHAARPPPNPATLGRAGPAC